MLSMQVMQNARHIKNPHISVNQNHFGTKIIPFLKQTDPINILNGFIKEKRNKRSK